MSALNYACNQVTLYYMWQYFNIPKNWAAAPPSLTLYLRNKTNYYIHGCWENMNNKLIKEYLKSVIVRLQLFVRIQGNNEKIQNFYLPVGVLNLNLNENTCLYELEVISACKLQKGSHWVTYFVILLKCTVFHKCISFLLKRVNNLGLFYIIYQLTSKWRKCRRRHWILFESNCFNI